MLDWAMAQPGVQDPAVPLRRRVPGHAPTTTTCSRHLDEYFDGADVPRAARPRHRRGRARCRSASRSTAAGGPPEHHAAWPSSSSSAPTPAEAVDGPAPACGAAGSAFTVDLLGEKTVVEAEADRYAARVVELARPPWPTPRAGWAPDDHLERDDLGPLPRVNVAIKPTALATHFEPLTPRGRPRAAPRRRIRPILRLAARARRVRPRRHGALRRQGPHAAAVPRAARRARVRRRRTPASSIQAYLKDSRDDLAELIAWSSRRPAPAHRAAGEGRLLGHRDGARPRRGLAGPGVRAQGRDRRQLRALRPAAARPPRRGAGRVR